MTFAKREDFILIAGLGYFEFKLNYPCRSNCQTDNNLKLGYDLF